jgi:SAM-dependent methyltransferase
MKRGLKAWLHRHGRLELAEELYFNLRTLSPGTLYRELRYRAWDAPDGYPVPPARLIKAVIASRWNAVYFDSGKRIMEDMADALAQHGLGFASFRAILDFGCGCGRLVRHLDRRTDAALYGSDYAPELVQWCQKHLPIGTFVVNGAEPPLPFDANTFDFIYARSVFTHWPEPVQLRWMNELRRVLFPGGYLLFTMHGRPLSHGLASEERALFEANELVVRYATDSGRNLCSSYASRAYVDRKLMDGFERVAFIEGRPIEHLRQDIHLVRRAAETTAPQPALRNEPP